MKIKNLLLLLNLFPFFCSGQMLYEAIPLQQDVVVVNAANPSQAGADRIAIPFKIPYFTNGYFLRITVVQKERNLPIGNTSLESELSIAAKEGTSLLSGTALLTKLSNPVRTDSVEVFVLDGEENRINFETQNDSEWSGNSMKNTFSSNVYFDKIPQQGYICLRNRHWDQEVNVKIELVAEIGWGKNSNEALYRNSADILSIKEELTEAQLKSVKSCFVKHVTSKPITEIKKMKDYELYDLFKRIDTECRKSTNK